MASSGNHSRGAHTGRLCGLPACLTQRELRTRLGLKIATAVVQSRKLKLVVLGFQYEISCDTDTEEMNWSMRLKDEIWIFPFKASGEVKL